MVSKFTETPAPQVPAGLPAVPPGFTSHTSFVLERVRDDGIDERVEVENTFDEFDEEELRNTLQKKPWINFGATEDRDSDSEQIEHDVPFRKCLPKGVIRGCSDCPTCQKVIARWRPEEACRPVLEEAPAFYPTEEEFKDTLKYISSIRSQAEPYGICRIVPPSSWKPSCPLKEKDIWENSEFSTYIQPIDKLQSRCSIELMDHNIKSRKRQRLNEQKERPSSDRDFKEASRPGSYDIKQSLAFEHGPKFTLKAFKKYADDFFGQYFSRNGTDVDLKSNRDQLKKGWKPSVKDVEGEYWRIVEKPTDEIEVLYGSSLDTKTFGSGFPKTSSKILNHSSEDKYQNSGWNFNNTPCLPGSMLSFEGRDVPGVIIPSLHVGMCFSSSCWHTEEHYLYSLNYLHWGASKVWYGVPGRYSLKLEAAIEKHHSTRPAEQRYLHNHCSPSILKSEGVPVYHCVQHSGEFILTFPQAYCCGFNCGFNCTEAVNMAPIDWLPYGQNAAEIYRDRKHMVSISHDKLLLGAAREAVRAQWNISFLKRFTPNDLTWRDACGKGKIIARALKERVLIECKRRDFFCRPSQTRKMNSDFGAIENQRCVVCHYDLHLSAAGCSCSLDKFACLNHTKQLCQCDESKKFFLFRYTICELNTLNDAMEAKLSAVHKWAISDLGLSQSSRSSKDTDHEWDFASEACSTDSMPPMDDNVHDNIQKTGMDLASGLHPVLPVQDQVHNKIAISTSLTCDGGVTLIPTSDKIMPETSSDVSRKDHIVINDERDNSKVSVSFPTREGGQLALESARVPRNHANLQKGPRLGKMVQSRDYMAEPLQYGTIISKRLWSTSQAIFPKGYRSRVSYISVINPSQMCNYVSEILDAGLPGPLFMVQVEQCPSEVFIHASATKCWDMVRERVNQEIRRQHSFGKFDVPPPQPPSSVDGLQMFGLTTPVIAQALEALDVHHVCSEYWNSRSGCMDPSSTSMVSGEAAAKIPETQEHCFSESVFRRLIKKASSKELDTLHHILSNDQLSVKQEAVQILDEEIGFRAKNTSDLC